MCRLVPTLSISYFFVNKRFSRTPNPLGNTFRHVAKASNPSGNDFRRARKCQTFRETTFAVRGNAKPFGKRLSPCAEMPNPSGNDFRHARKCQTKGFNTSTRRITIFSEGCQTIVPRYILFAAWDEKLLSKTHF